MCEQKEEARKRKKEHKNESLLCEELLCASFMLFAIAFGYVFSVQEFTLTQLNSDTVGGALSFSLDFCEFTLYGGGVWRLHLMTLKPSQT